MESGGKFDATHAPRRGLELDKVCVWSTANLSPPGFFLGKVPCESLVEAAGDTHGSGWKNVGVYGSSWKLQQNIYS